MMSTGTRASCCSLRSEVPTARAVFRLASSCAQEAKMTSCPWRTAQCLLAVNVRRLTSAHDSGAPWRDFQKNSTICS